MVFANARAGVHRPDQHELGREADRPLGPPDRDDPVLQRLAQHFERLVPELRDLVQEQHAAVGQADLAGPRPADAPADQTGVRDGVVRRPERPPAQQRPPARQLAGDRVQLGHLQRLLGPQGRQEPRQRPRQQRLAGPRRPDHQHRVAPGRGDLQGPLGVLLPAHVRQEVGPGATYGSARRSRRRITASRRSTSRGV